MPPATNDHNKQNKTETKTKLIQRGPCCPRSSRPRPCTLPSGRTACECVRWRSANTLPHASPLRRQWRPFPARPRGRTGATAPAPTDGRTDRRLRGRSRRRRPGRSRGPRLPPRDGRAYARGDGRAHRAAVRGDDRDSGGRTGATAPTPTGTAVRTVSASRRAITPTSAGTVARAAPASAGTVARTPTGTVALTVPPSAGTIVTPGGRTWATAPAPTGTAVQTLSTSPRAITPTCAGTVARASPASAGTVGPRGPLLCSFEVSVFL